MPSARLVFNDDATVLGPVLERTGEMIKAATSDIPRLRFAQEGLALDRERFGHTKQMDAANLKMRQDAAQAEADNALMGGLFGPGAAGGTRTTGLTSTRGLAWGVTPGQNLSQQRFEAQQQRYAEQSARREAEVARRQQEAMNKYKADRTAEVVEDPTTGEKRKRTPEEIAELVNIHFPAPEPPATGTYAEHPFGTPAMEGEEGVEGGEVPEDGGSLDTNGLLTLQQDMALSAYAQQQALDLQRKRAAWVQLKNDPQRAARMGIDENRMYELYQQLWPQTGNTEETVGPIDFSAPGVVAGPQEEQVTDLLTLRAADAAHASRGRPPAEVSELPAEAPAAPMAAPRPPIDPRRMNDVRARAMTLLARNTVPDPYYANTRAHAAARYSAEKAGAPLKPLAPTPQEARAMIQELIEVAPPAKQAVLNAMLDKINPNQASRLQRFGNFVGGFDEMKILEQAFQSIFPDQSYAGYASPTDLRIEREQVERYGRR